MTKPVRIVPGRTMLTRRCTQRQFLMSPDSEMNNAFLYCIGEAAQMFNIKLIAPTMMSNHYHCPCVDPDGKQVEFTHRFHTHLSKCTNAHRGRWESMWSSDSPSRVELVEPCDLMDAIVYSLANPVVAGLVDTVAHWPGPNFLNALLDGRTIRARRPRFFDDDGAMPEFVEFTLTLPSELGNPDEVRAEIERRIAEVEESCARERLRTGKRVVGRREIRRQAWHRSPSTVAPRRRMHPRVKARNPVSRIAALNAHQEFVIAYRAARSRWLVGEPAIFPSGTYWLRKFAANVLVAPFVA